MKNLISWGMAAIILGCAMKLLGSAILAISAGSVEVGLLALTPALLSFVALPALRLLS